MLLHSGPPIAWERVCDPQRRALVAACLLEGWAADRDARRRCWPAARSAGGGNEHGHVGPMTGVCSPSMAVWVVRGRGSGARAFSTLNEGPGRTLWFGVGDDEAVERAALPARPRSARCSRACSSAPGRSTSSTSPRKGCRWATSCTCAARRRPTCSAPPAAGLAAEGGEDVAAALAANHLFFLNLTMAAAKCASLAAAGPPVDARTLMARNGTDWPCSSPGCPAAGSPRRPRPSRTRSCARASRPRTPRWTSATRPCSSASAWAGWRLRRRPRRAFFGGGAADAAARRGSWGRSAPGAGALHPARDGLRGHPVGIDARLVAELGWHRRSRPASCTRRTARGRSARASHTSRRALRDALEAGRGARHVIVRGDRRAVHARLPAPRRVRRGGALSSGTASSRCSRRPGRRGCPTQSRSARGRRRRRRHGGADRTWSALAQRGAAT